MKSLRTEWLLMLIVPVIAAAQINSYAAASAQASGVTYYVDVNYPNAQDSSNHGRIDRPWKTLEYGFQQLRPGDTLLIRGGTYANKSITLTAENSGWEGAPITVKAHPGEQVILRNGGGIRFYGASWWVIDGLIFEQYTDRLFDLGMHTQAGYSETVAVEHITVKNCEFRHSSYSPFNISNANYVLLENNYFHHLRSGVTGQDLSVVKVPYVADRIVINNNRFEDIGSDGVHLANFGERPGSNVASVAIIGNRFWVNRPYTGPLGNVGENAIDVKWVKGPILIANNVIHGFRPTTPEQDATGDSGRGIAIHNSARNVLVVSNLFYDNTSHLGIGQGRGSSPLNLSIHHNVFREARRAERDGVLIGGYALSVNYAENIEAYHNTFYHNDLYLSSRNVVNGTFSNNLIWGGDDAVINSNSEWRADRNIWFETIGPIPQVLRGGHDLRLSRTLNTYRKLTKELVRGFQSPKER